MVKKQKAGKNCLNAELKHADDVSPTPTSGQTREEHMSQTVSEMSWKVMTIEEKRKPIYLIRYE